METEKKSILCGQRCRRARNNKGWSQQYLAEKVGLTPQAISKYEKEGIHDIDNIDLISNALMCDLQELEINQEGTVGAIGRELLYRLVNQSGHLETKGLNADTMYGLRKDEIYNEIFKLGEIGLCVRDVYTDVDGAEIDRLYITAKGLITIKNMLINSPDKFEKFQAHLEQITTYEKAIGTFSSRQEVVDSQPWLKIIYQLSYCKTYRMDYISYLFKNYANDRCRQLLSERTPGISMYYEIIYRMTFGITDEILWEAFKRNIKNIGFDVEPDKSAELKLGQSLLDNSEIVCSSANRAFEKLIPSVKDRAISKGEKTYSISQAGLDAYDTINAKLQLEIEHEPLFPNLESQYQEICEQFDSAYPTNWFSKEEIEKFIDENYHGAVSEEEKEMDKFLADLNECEPETLSYYKFPMEWETNGLADKVRNLYGLKKR